MKVYRDDSIPYKPFLIYRRYLGADQHASFILANIDKDSYNF